MGNYVNLYFVSNLEWIALSWFLDKFWKGCFRYAYFAYLDAFDIGSGASIQSTRYSRFNMEYDNTLTLIDSPPLNFLFSLVNLREDTLLPSIRYARLTTAFFSLILSCSLFFHWSPVSKAFLVRGNRLHALKAALCLSLCLFFLFSCYFFLFWSYVDLCCCD